VQNGLEHPNKKAFSPQSQGEGESAVRSADERSAEVKWLSELSVENRQNISTTFSWNGWGGINGQASSLRIPHQFL
jgi:hypothetical protein